MLTRSEVFLIVRWECRCSEGEDAHGDRYLSVTLGRTRSEITDPCASAWEQGRPVIIDVSLDFELWPTSFDQSALGR